MAYNERGRIWLITNPIILTENGRQVSESKFQAALIKELKLLFPGCLVLKNDSGYIQGIPDLLVLHGDRWAALECKVSWHARQQPNQEWYVEKMDDMSFAAFISPENRELILAQLQQAFRTRR